MPGRIQTWNLHCRLRSVQPIVRCKNLTVSYCSRRRVLGCRLCQVGDGDRLYQGPKGRCSNIQSRVRPLRPLPIVVATKHVESLICFFRTKALESCSNVSKSCWRGRVHMNAFKNTAARPAVCLTPMSHSQPPMLEADHDPNHGPIERPTAVRIGFGQHFTASFSTFSIQLPQQSCWTSKPDLVCLGEVIGM